MKIEHYLEEGRVAVEQTLERLLVPENERPATIHRAMRYSVFAGGKRVRPILVLAAGESVGADRAVLLELGAAVELIHTYSLIHDDLPALDNDDLRRGRPTCHRAFGEAMAILAGDALLTRAFQVLGGLRGLAAETRLQILQEVGRAIGTVDGMIGGQVEDLQAEGKAVDAETLAYIHGSKTGALLAVCTRCGALAAEADPAQREALATYGARVGLAFQIVDDILDVTSTTEHLGKTAGKDVRENKATYPSVHGVERSREQARLLIEEARDAVSGLGKSAEPLRALARFILDRTA